VEIAKAIHVLATQVEEEEEKIQRQAALAAIRRDCQLCAGVFREFCQDLQKAGFRLDQPRWRKGSGRRSGRWSGGAGGLAAEERERRKKGGHH
jgi:hypothetical protein